VKVRPKDLEYPEKITQVFEGIWHIPQVENDPFDFQGFSSIPFFNNENPTYLEICSGNGLWIFERAKGNLEVNWAGIEMKWSRIRKIWSKIQNHSLKNLMGVHGEANYVLNRFFKPETVDKIFINFPDPWPKRKHSKYRLIQPPFISQLARILKPKGEICIVTDDMGYSKQIVKYMLQSKLFDSPYGEPHYTTDLPDYGTSYFEELWRGKEKEIRYHIYEKKHLS
jgi:tRNA (guanine-N7-)-methyltransferase